MYYLFIHKDKDLEIYKSRLLKVMENRDKGRSPVFNEISNAKCQLIESFPLNIILGTFMIIGTILIDKIKINETIKIGFILIINSFCYAISNYIFTVIKNYFRIKLCKRLNIEPTEDVIGAMESLEYQSV